MRGLVFKDTAGSVQAAVPQRRHSSYSSPFRGTQHHLDLPCFWVGMGWSVEHNALVLCIPGLDHRRHRAAITPEHVFALIWV